MRTRDDRGAAVVQSLREIVRRVEPQLPLSSVETMEEVVASGLRTSRSQMLLLGIFAGIALALAAAGLYGLVAYTVAQRTREIGIHMALGATAGVILRRIVARGLLLTLAGLVVGLGAATITSRWLETSSSASKRSIRSRSSRRRSSSSPPPPSPALRRRCGPRASIRWRFCATTDPMACHE